MLSYVMLAVQGERPFSYFFNYMDRPDREIYYKMLNSFNISISHA